MTNYAHQTMRYAKPIDPKLQVRWGRFSAWLTGKGMLLFIGSFLISVAAYLFSQRWSVRLHHTQVEPNDPFLQSDHSFDLYLVQKEPEVYGRYFVKGTESGRV